MVKYPIIFQKKSRLCGPICIMMIASYHNIKHNLKLSDIKSFDVNKGISLLELKKIALEIGLKSKAIEISYQGLKQIQFPVIAHWKNRHYVVIYKIKNDVILIGDPLIGILEYSKGEFMVEWIKNNNKGVILELFL